MGALLKILEDASAKTSARARLEQFLAERRRAKEAVPDLEAFERELHELVAAMEAEVIGDELARHDVDVPAVVIDGVVHRRVLRCEQEYLTAAGPVRVERSLYSTRDGEPAMCPMELRAGIVEGHWTPRAARQAAWVVAHLVPQEGEALFDELGGMKPSKSSLDRLPKHLSSRWEAERERFERALRESEPIPKEAATVAVSLDGVMAPMKDGQRKQKRARAREEGKETRGPAGHEEVGCATLTLYDRDGERLQTVRMARMPETKKATLKQTLADELDAVRGARPDLQIVKLADGAKDNWTFLSGLPGQVQVADFYHAAEHLKSALAAAYGENDPKGDAQYEKLRHVLRHDDDGVEKVIRALVYLRNTHPRSRKLKTELGYFREHRHRMRYAEVAAKNLPIGSGVVEAACKTLVTQRLKRSGMRWRPDGGQAILTLRALIQSDRFDRGWHLLRTTYTKHVALPDNVVPLPSRRAR
jgi:hypothetical protein